MFAFSRSVRCWLLGAESGERISRVGTRSTNGFDRLRDCGWSRTSFDSRKTDGLELTSRAMSCRTRLSGRNLLIVLIAGAFTLADVGVRSMPFALPQKDLAADVDGFVAAVGARDHFSGSVLLSHNGQPLVRRGYGFADRRRRRPNTPDTPFMLSSVGKVFTAVMIAKLIEQKQLSFDTTLGALVPDYPLADARDHVSVGHLLTMSSGIQDLFRVPAFWSEIPTIKSPTDFWKVLRVDPATVPPGHAVGV